MANDLTEHRSIRLAPAVAGALVMLAWSWGRWPDPLVDFGRELYVPWQITRGKVLYRDIESFYGPLSPYLNSLWFTFFGVGLRTIVLCNLALMATLVWLLDWILVEVASRLASAAACTGFVLLFGFGQYIGTGNYNYLCPYSHEATHGLLLAVASLAFVMRYRASRKVVHASLAGLTLGAVFLTKPEPFIAALPSVSLALAFALRRPGPGSRGARTALGVFAASALAPPAVAFGLLWTAMPASVALRGTLGSWPFLFDARLRALPFFRAGMGTDHPGDNLVQMGLAAGLGVILLTPAALAAAFGGTRRRGRRAAPLLAFTAYAVLLAPTTHFGAWLALDGVLTLFALAGSVFCGVGMLRWGADERESARREARLSLFVFALLLLLKIVLYPRIFQYGFVLAMPAALLLIASLTDGIPRRLSGRGGRGEIFRAAAVAVLLVSIAAHLRLVHYWYAAMTFPVGTGPDAMRGNASATFVRAALTEMAGPSLPSGATLTVLPEGAMLNYLSRRSSPVPYLTFLPPDMIMFGEIRMLSSLRTHPPDMIALVHRDTSEFGSRWFGRDYGQEIMGWVRENYRPFAAFGDPPLQSGSHFGILLLMRNMRSAHGIEPDDDPWRGAESAYRRSAITTKPAP